jgi:hypothetical protein
VDIYQLIYSSVQRSEDLVLMRKLCVFNLIFKEHEFSGANTLI